MCDKYDRPSRNGGVHGTGRLRDDFGLTRDIMTKLGDPESIAVDRATVEEAETEDNDDDDGDGDGDKDVELAAGFN